MSLREGEVVIVDLGVGNLGNVRRALRFVGAEAEVSAEPAVIATARRLVLPGVGAFRPPRERLRGALEGALREALDSGATLLGICVGFQLLFESSDEFGPCDGLGLLEGTVTRLPDFASGVPVRLPHIGWNRLERTSAHPFVAGLGEAEQVYFVHSFAPAGVPDEQVLATSRHGRPFAAIAGSGRIVGCQFHPEKSSRVGLDLLASFVAMRPAGEGEADLTAVVSGPASRPQPQQRRPQSRQDFELFAAIDLRRGQVVRLRHGDDDQKTVYGDDPVATLVSLRDAGVSWAHIVDLDAAFGEEPQTELLARLVGVEGRPRLQVGGGFRTAAAIEAALALGIDRLVVGSLVGRDPELFASLARQFPGRLVAGLDARGEHLAVDGWRQVGEAVLKVAGRLRDLPLAAVLVTDVGRDGALGGPNVELALELARASGTRAQLSGGVSSLEDLQRAAKFPELEGAVVGTALYEGRFTLAEALSVCEGAKASTLAVRVIPCLDVAGGRVVKGLKFQNLRDMGDPAEAAARYDAQGADELVFLDVTASVEDRNTRRSWVEAVAQQVFIPLTVGGGVRSVDDARELLLAGADKVAVNSAAVDDPELVTRLSETFGSQCVVLSVDARRRDEGGWEVVTHGGRRSTGLDVLDFLADRVARGAGEVLLTSIDSDGTRDGYDLELLEAAAARVGVPLIASGGAGRVEHLIEALQAGADAVLAASIFHEGDLTVAQVKDRVAEAGFLVREVGEVRKPELRPSEDSIRFDANGLVPVIAQDRTTGVVLMLAWANREAIDRTLASGEVWFWSRSRGRLWKKGESSGNVLKLCSLRHDCDGDTLLAIVDPVGPSCHTGARTCFDGETPSTAALELGWLEEVLAQRALAPPTESYTARLLAKGLPRVAQKVGEEATEVVVAALGEPEKLADEAADLLYHLLVLLQATGTPLSKVAQVLAARHASTTTPAAALVGEPR